MSLAKVHKIIVGFPFLELAQYFCFFYSYVSRKFLKKCVSSTSIDQKTIVLTLFLQSKLSNFCVLLGFFREKRLETQPWLHNANVKPPARFDRARMSCRYPEYFLFVYVLHQLNHQLFVGGFKMNSSKSHSVKWVGPSFFLCWVCPCHYRHTIRRLLCHRCLQYSL